MPWRAALLALTLTGCAATSGQPYAPTPRDRATIAEFRRTHPCPATGRTTGACPGWQVDHIEPLCAGGADAQPNLHWLDTTTHQRKTRADVARCRTLRLG